MIQVFSNVILAIGLLFFLYHLDKKVRPKLEEQVKQLKDEKVIPL